MGELADTINRTIREKQELEELIAKTVTMTVAETIKQLMPIMQPQNNTTCRDILKEDTRARRLKQSKIAQLKPELRTIVDDMLLSRQYRYIDVQSFLRLHGIAISLSAIGSYKNTLYLD